MPNESDSPTQAKSWLIEMPGSESLWSVQVGVSPGCWTRIEGERRPIIALGCANATGGSIGIVTKLRREKSAQGTPKAPLRTQPVVRMMRIEQHVRRSI